MLRLHLPIPMNSAGIPGDVGHLIPSKPAGRSIDVGLGGESPLVDCSFVSLWLWGQAGWVGEASFRRS
jgi:hypothetical protein